MGFDLDFLSVNKFAISNTNNTNLNLEECKLETITIIIRMYQIIIPLNFLIIILLQIIIIFNYIRIYNQIKIIIIVIS